uniref:Uncharacterized protein n=1 Tax=Knipowitschia caucasica TaxID=637954 RepID=A0AAV2M6B8_KNICA
MTGAGVGLPCGLGPLTSPHSGDITSTSPLTAHVRARVTGTTAESSVIFSPSPHIPLAATGSSGISITAHLLISSVDGALIDQAETVANKSTG